MIIQELVPLGSLLSYLIENADKIKPNVELKIWASQIASGKYWRNDIRVVVADVSWLVWSLLNLSEIVSSRYALSGDTAFRAS